MFYFWIGEHNKKELCINLESTKSNQLNIIKPNAVILP